MAQPNEKSGLDARVTQSIKATTNQEERRSKLFLLRRRPSWGMKREWVRPPDEQYKRELLEEGFISDPLLDKSMSSELATDVRELDQHLLPHFWRVNQHAEFYQNRYYQYQWAFILSAFLTTVLAAVNVFVYAKGWDDQAIVGRIQPTEVLGLLTAIISGIATAVSFLDTNQTPQKRWFRARTQSESLRSMYFLFLARSKPFDSASTRERVTVLRQRVIDVLRETPSTAAQRGAPRPKPGEPAQPVPENGVREGGTNS
ncbi:MAG: DUF4231 domain-containing protein [Chloroflexi bacterium]|nr:MAG: DUF4231 domain-containing protein [Chloroflexota bacterium]